ncbi:MAG: double-strand break repair protein AddB [Xanthobacteraceae bacterium]|nr:MAG: double-strand break repair protein AddB [Xanthobacteraceae bacterium]
MRVVTVPPSAPFLRSVIAALVDGRLVEGFTPRDEPARLADATLYLPTRRACRLVRDTFLDVLQTEAAILPRLVALGEVDEDELEFARAAGGEEADLDLTPALGGLERRLLLARLITAWARRAPGGISQPAVVAGPASALALADDLARVMDDMTTRNVSWQALGTLVPDALDDYWQQSLAFLKIASEQWPAILAERGRIDAAARRDRLIAAEAARLARWSAGPVIAAGSTGSMPATAAFLAAVARLPRGAVVLPGLDTELDDGSWAAIGGGDADAVPPAPGHPQYAMHGLLARLGIARTAVVPLVSPQPHGRETLASEAMRPAATTALWRARLEDQGRARGIERGLEHVAVVAAATSEEEALAIALAMAEAHADHHSAALVTPDRALARRVIAALARWNLAVDDSGGDALTDTAAGVFARLTAQAATELAPAFLLALLKHGLFRLGRAEGAWRPAIAALELALLRGPRPPSGSTGLARAFAAFRASLNRLRRGEDSPLHPSEPRARLTTDDCAAAHDLIARLAEALAPLERDEPPGPSGFGALAERHRAALVALADDGTGACAAFAGPDGQVLQTAFDDILDLADADALEVTRHDYADTFVAAMADRVVRRPGAPGARLRIFGPLEARLTTCDRVILGGLAEGVWPPQTTTDPWLSRPMRHQLGLDLPERRIGLSAHDFVQLLGAREVVLTRAAKVDGAPAVPSRFLNRLAAVAGAEPWRAAAARGETYLHWARALDQPARVEPVAPPQPKPPLAARPRRLSVTEIEHWLRDPYTIYAKHILKLSQLDPVDQPLSAADRGSAIHGALGDFTARFAYALPRDVAAELTRCGEARFAALMDAAEARALWWPRFARIAAWFARWETTRRGGLAHVFAELRGGIDIPMGNGSFHLAARADRVDRLADGSYAILDYKTGAAPTAKQELIGVAPQLSLEAAILRHGGFADIAAGSSVSELMYVRLSGNDPAGEAQPLELRLGRGEEALSPDAAAARALDKLTALIAAFADPDMPYRSLQLPMWKNRYGAYDDLARVKEWSATAGASDDIGNGNGNGNGNGGAPS